jgi:hypothetical protein
VDNTHAFTDTRRKDPFVGVGNLWNQVLNESGEGDEYNVTYKQDILKFGLSIGVQRSYTLTKGTSKDQKRQVALSIFQDVSIAFESLQGLHPTSGSSFEPADLPSNMLSFYRSVYDDLSTARIKNLIDPLNSVSSLQVYRQYPGTFTDSKYKNRTFYPVFFESVYTPSYYDIPQELRRLTPEKIGGDLLKFKNQSFIHFSTK